MSVIRRSLLQVLMQCSGIKLAGLLNARYKIFKNQCLFYIVPGLTLENSDFYTHTHTDTHPHTQLMYVFLNDINRKVFLLKTAYVLCEV